MKRLDYWMIIGPFSVLTGATCAPTSPASFSLATELNENDAGQISPETVTPAPEPEAPTAPVITPPTAVPSLPSAPPSLPPPSSEPEPIPNEDAPLPPQPAPFVEPELTTFTCNQFPPLPSPPVGSSSGKEIVRLLTDEEISYFWQDSFCLPFDDENNDDPEELDCEHLFIGTAGAGFDTYHIITKFALIDLPIVDEVENVNFNLYPLGGSVFFFISPSMERLTTDWFRACPVDPIDWRAICPEDFPAASGLETDWHRFDDGENETRWLSFNITEPYRDWQTGAQPNYGLLFGEGNVFNLLIFASAAHSNPELHPRLVFTPKAVESIDTLRFPLAGNYDTNRITGDNFGAWSQEGRCDGTDNPMSPRLRHTGIDLRATLGEEVYAVQDGTVMYAATDAKWGGYVVLEHNEQWTSTYTHVWPIVSLGEKVTRGQQIAVIAPGNENFHSHLHFQIRLAPYEEPWSRRGRLPETECFVTNTGIFELEFPEHFVDPKCLDWE